MSRGTLSRRDIESRRDKDSRRDVDSRRDIESLRDRESLRDMELRLESVRVRVGAVSLGLLGAREAGGPVDSRREGGVFPRVGGVTFRSFFSSLPACIEHSLLTA